MLNLQNLKKGEITEVQAKDGKQGTSKTKTSKRHYLN